MRTGWLLILLLPVVLYAQDAVEKAPALIPMPVSIKSTGHSFTTNAATVIYCPDTALHRTAGLLGLYLSSYKQSCRLVAAKPAANYISLYIDSAAIPQSEGYTLQVNKDHIALAAHDIAGLIHGIQSLRQLWQTTAKNTLTIPGYAITDYPGFAYRGMALDVSRHFFPVAFIKQYIDLLSLYKFNTFHWHLTDDQGWRIEIKRYPRLQSVAAWRAQTLIGHKKETPHRFDGKPYGGYYTQEEIKEVVQYAAQRGITIIPEIEMPGHALAALSAWPALGCTGGPYATATFWGVFEEVFCAGNDSTFVFLQNVLDEVLSLFPSRYIHIGGDECPKTRWKACAKCQQRMQALSLKDEHDLQSYFIQRIEKYLNSKGRDIIGWDEILEGGLAPNATVMSWRGEEGGITAAQQKHRVIMTPESYLYFDYYQSRQAAEPVAAGNYTPLNKVYNYQPAGTLPDTLLSYIAGVEGQAWSEYYTNEQQATYMIFPRAMALAELAWTPAAMRNYDQFLQRLRGQSALLRQLQVTYYTNFDEVVGMRVRPLKGTVELSLYTPYPDAAIYYTTDNSIPSPKGVLRTGRSPVYKGPVVMNKSGILKALAFDKRGQPLGRIFQQAVTVHKGIGASVTVAHQPLERWNPGTAVLVNGVAGSARYNDGQWLGFSGDDLEAVIDLGTTQPIQSLQMNLLNYHWQRIWAPVVLNIEVSEDGIQYRKLFTQRNFPVNGINTVRAIVKGVKARYIKVTGINKGIIPAGEYGAGSKALLMIDEIIIN
ncbi:beta-N-acetylhexosaminidase [Paraflavitalea devenefica]|uniref:beta-N-acetylhexosaminidase n=1 Tax=Paraflavitalea devenefica TaxID=2716334 RepID=UPI001FE860DF|nr:family 20 glycosylhydrolase [Paraflavitalea devenefica]